MQSHLIQAGLAGETEWEDYLATDLGLSRTIFPSLCDEAFFGALGAQLRICGAHMPRG